MRFLTSLRCIRNDNGIILAFSLIYLIIVLGSTQIPFFWTMGGLATVANRIFESGLTVFAFPDVDAGTPPLYTAYIALLWQIFGRSLWVMHIAAFPFIVGVLIQIKYLRRNVNAEISLMWLYILLLFEPTFLTLSILGSYDLAICFLMLYVVNAIVSNSKKIAFILVLAALVLINQRGFMIVFGFFLMDLYYAYRFHKQIRAFSTLLRFLIPYIVSLVFFMAWLGYHYYVLGWFIVADSFEGFHRLNSAEMLLRNFVYIFWKIFDFGRFVIWIPVLIFIGIQLLRRKLFSPENQVHVILLFSMLYYFIFLFPTAYPVSHRYFLCSYLIIIIPFLLLMKRIGRKYVRNVLLTSCCLLMLAGNFVLYPERFGNGWDASLKCLPYFKLEKQLLDYVRTENIEFGSIQADYPMNFDFYDIRLIDEHLQFKDLDKNHFGNIRYIVQSNISNNFTPSMLTELEQEWVLQKEFKAGQIYIRLYRNPYLKWLK